MSKRLTSHAVSCPGCTMKFDFEDHIRLIGSCDHSLCAVCANDIEICPVCQKPGGFLEKEKRGRDKETWAIPVKKEAKKSRIDAPKSKYSIFTLLHAKNSAVFAQIVNYLDPSSFVKFSRTCKAVNTFCFNSKDIRIINDDYTLTVDIRRFIPVFQLKKDSSKPIDLHFCSHNHKGTSYGGFLNYPKNRKTLRKNYPFVFKLRKLFIYELNPVMLDSIRSFLAEFPVKEIYRILTHNVCNWEGFPQFVEDFQAGKVIVPDCRGSPRLPEETMKFFLQNKSIKLRCHQAIPKALGGAVLKRKSVPEASDVTVLKKKSNPGATLKRPALMNISCPGCTASFDLGPHFPYIGSCGHSLCSTCVNEKKTTMCPVCNNPEGFVWNQKNELATEIMALLDGKRAKKPRLEAAGKVENPFSALFNPENKKLLTRIVNKFEPDDFVKLAMTCSKMKDFCLDNKKIKIIYDLYVKVDLRHGVPLFAVAKASDSLDDVYPQNYTGSSGGFFSTPGNRKKLRNASFSYRIEFLTIYGTLTSSALLTIRSFLAEFPIGKIDGVRTNGITDWYGFTNFLTHFKPSALEIAALSSRLSLMPNVTATHIVQNTVKFICDLPISDKIILESPSNVILELRNSAISRETFEELIKKCSNSEEDIDWTLGCRSFLFNDFGVSKKILPFDHEGRVSKKPPLAFVNEKEPYHFYILRKDGKMVHCFKTMEGPAHFVMMHPSDYPPCLQSKS